MSGSINIWTTKEHISTSPLPHTTVSCNFHLIEKKYFSPHPTHTGLYEYLDRLNEHLFDHSYENLYEHSYKHSYEQLDKKFI